MGSHESAYKKAYEKAKAQELFAPWEPLAGSEAGYVKALKKFGVVDDAEQKPQIEQKTEVQGPKLTFRMYGGSGGGSMRI